MVSRYYMGFQFILNPPPQKKNKTLSFWHLVRNRINIDVYEGTNDLISHGFFVLIIWHCLDWDRGFSEFSRLYTTIGILSNGC